MLCTGMDIAPGGKDESQVPIAKRLNAEVDLGERVQLLISTITLTMYNYISQVCNLPIKSMSLHQNSTLVWLSKFKI